MLDSISSAAAFATQQSNQNLTQQVDVALLKKAQDLQDQQGQSALQLIAASTVTANKIDVYA